MPKVVVASVQQQMRLFDTLEEYRKELNRFLYLARAKGAKLVAFPALTGLMAVAPQVEGFRMNLLRRADERYRRQKTLWMRTRSALAGSTAGLLKVSFRKALTALAHDDPASLVAGYEAVFRELSEAYGITIVAGSAYLADASGTLRQRALVFGPDGKTLGYHDKLLLDAEDEGLAETGDGWTAIDTPAGRIGILFGQEALYPEAGRLLAYEGANVLVILGTTSSETAAAYVRQAALARAQDNQCFVLSSFLVGKNYLAPDQREAADFAGKSGIYAPLEMTPRFSGVMVEMGTATSEGLITAEVDSEELYELWRSGTQRVRSRMPVKAFGDGLAAAYSAHRTLADGAQQAPLLPAGAALPALTAGEAEQFVEADQEQTEVWSPPEEATGEHEEQGPEQAGALNEMEAETGPIAGAQDESALPGNGDAGAAPSEAEDEDR